MHIPYLGAVTKDEQFDYLVSEPVGVPALDGNECRFVLEGYEGDASPDDFHAAIRNLLLCTPRVIQDAASHVAKYCRTFQDACVEPTDEAYIDLASDAEVWDHVTFGSELCVSRRAGGDRGVYVSLECECGWEPEHGLQLVFRDGSAITKVGPFDGHLSNADAYGVDSLEDVVFVE